MQCGNPFSYRSNELTFNLSLTFQRHKLLCWVGNDKGEHLSLPTLPLTVV